MNSIKKQLAKYDSSTTYLSRFCCAPGEPYYVNGPANFLKAGITELTKIIAEDNFETDAQKQLALTLFADYQNFYRLYIKSTGLDKQQKNTNFLNLQR